MTTYQRLLVTEIEALALRALLASNVSENNAAAVAHSIALAERDGQKIVGLSYLPTYCDHAACGKVDGHARPILERASIVAIKVNANAGFAHPALRFGMSELADAALAHGIAILAVGNSYACGSLGYFVEALAESGLLAIMFANASPSMAAYGGKAPFFGTNPIAFAAPRANAAPLVIDQSSSVVAKVAVIDAYRHGIALPEGWALDQNGRPTTDAALAMEGSLVPAGGYKGTGLALMVDILAGGLTQSHFSFEASSFGDVEGGPPRTGQLMIAINPAVFGGSNFTDRIEVLLTAMLASGDDVRLPGAQRVASRLSHQHGIDVPTHIIETLEMYAANGSPLMPSSNTKA
jgi:(2R)-3-sulfolactate dehydrogenase (NADP+)